MTASYPFILAGSWKKRACFFKKALCLKIQKDARDLAYKVYSHYFCCLLTSRQKLESLSPEICSCSDRGCGNQGEFGQCIVSIRRPIGSRFPSFYSAS